MQQTFYQKYKKAACYFKEYNLKYLLPMIKFKCSSKKNRTLDNLTLPPWATHYLDLSHKIGDVLTNVINKILYHEVCQHEEYLQNSVFFTHGRF